MPSKLASVTGAELIPANVSRKSLIVQNEDNTDSVFIMRERAENTLISTTVHDLKVPPGGAVTLNWINDGLQQIQSRYTFIASANTPRVSFFETEDVAR